LAYQIAFINTNNDAESADRFILAVQYVNIVAEKKEEKVYWKE